MDDVPGLPSLPTPEQLANEARDAVAPGQALTLTLMSYAQRLAVMEAKAAQLPEALARLDQLEAQIPQIASADRLAGLDAESARHQFVEARHQLTVLADRLAELEAQIDAQTAQIAGADRLAEIEAQLAGIQLAEARHQYAALAARLQGLEAQIDTQGAQIAGADCLAEIEAQLARFQLVEARHHLAAFAARIQVLEADRQEKPPTARR